MLARIVLVIVTALAWPAARLASQSISVTTVDGVVRVAAPGFRFITGEPLARLKDGQSLRVDLVVSALPKPGAAPAAQRRRTFVLSYDLWEERFAVALADAPSRSVSHLTSTAAEVWCIQQLDLRVGALGSLAKNLPFWIRLEYQVLDSVAAEPNDGGYTLQSLIDALSRRRKSGDLSHAIEAGPFRVKE
jgi:hypothetical protein